MKKQTAVEWLYEHILLTPLDIRSINKCLEQAKEMEKEQITEAFKQGIVYWNGDEWKLIDINSYYKNTFNN